ncbi:MAG: peptidoglycan recognition family protein, partial [Chthoniobacterales bacterium]
PEPTPEPTPAPTPEPTPKPKSTPKKDAKDDSDAPIVVEKSGKSDEAGLAPPPKKKGGFLWFGRGPKYEYLSESVRSSIDDAKVKKGRWKYIIVHNSGTRQGNAKAFDNYHKNVRKMRNGMAYHFVVGNGTSSGNGEIEIGNRWVRQINGGHVASDYLNNISIGICLVGDLNRDLPTKVQIAALDELIEYLRKRCGKSGGKDIIVRGHKQINPKPTDCPGDRFPLKWLNSEFKD